MKHPQGQRKFEPRTDLARDLLVRAILAGANRELTHPCNSLDCGAVFPGKHLVTDTPDPRDGRARFFWTTSRGRVIRVTLGIGFDARTLLGPDGRFREIRDADIEKVEVLVSRPGARTPLGPRGDGPLPYTKWLSPQEYAMAAQLHRDLVEGEQCADAALTTDPNWPGWIFIEIPRPSHSDQALVIALPLADGPWGNAPESAFFWIIASKTPINGRRLKLESDVRLEPAALRRNGTVVRR